MQGSHKYSHKNSNNMEPITERSKSLLLFNSTPHSVKSQLQAQTLLMVQHVAFQELFPMCYTYAHHIVLKQNLVAKGWHIIKISYASEKVS